MSATILDWVVYIILAILLEKGIRSMLTVMGLMFYIRKEYRVSSFDAGELLRGLSNKGWSKRLKTLDEKVKNLKDWG